MVIKPKYLYCILLLVILTIISTSISFASNKPNYVPGEVLIKLKDSIHTQSISVEKNLLKKFNAKKAEKLIKNTKIKPMSITNNKLYKLTLNDDISVDNFINSFSNDPSIEYIEPNYYLSLPKEENDIIYTSIKTNSTTPAYGNRTLVAVLDTGIDKEHSLIKPFLYTNTKEELNGIDDDGNGLVDDISGYDFSESINPQKEDNDPTDEDGHGTHVSGIIINNSSISGEGYVKILPVKIFDSSGNSTVESAIKAIDYAIGQGVKIINCSWGTNSNSSLLENAIKEAINSNILVVAAAGNEDSSTIYYPGAYNDVITVAAINENNTRFSLSCYGNHIDISAPGHHILSSWPGNQYTYLSGTSMATAAVTGILSTLIYKNSNLTCEQLKYIIYRSSDDITDPNNDGSNLIGKDIYTGYGKVNQEKALAEIENTSQIVLNPQNSDDLLITNLLNYPNPASATTTFGFNLSQNADVEISIYNLNGELINKLNLSGSKSSYNRVTWNLKDQMGQEMGNDVYIYVAKASNSAGQTKTQKGKLVILK